ncbi:MAG: hypothetical protein AAF708_22380 [Deinococcota bacterium]
MPRGAGGTSGGIPQFFIGLAMMIVGGYLLLNAIRVSHNFGLGSVLYRINGVGVTGGMVLIPFIAGVVIIFYDSRKIFGWILMIGAVASLIFGVISTIQFRLNSMSAFDLLLILILLFGGVGLFLGALNDADNGIR